MDSVIQEGYFKGNITAKVLETTDITNIKCYKFQEKWSKQT